MRTKLIATTLVVSFLTYLIYRWVASLPDTIYQFADDIEITTETGENIFWGKGRCHVCHRIGERGYALRGPNLGNGKEGAIISQRAAQRARSLGLKNRTSYLTQSIAQPGAFIVPNYKNEMPEVFKAPIALTLSEIKAVVLYLQSLGGHADADEIELPENLWTFFQHPSESQKFKIEGDAKAGLALFFDLNGPAACAACHVGIDIRGQLAGSKIGPDLSAVASIRSTEHLYRKIIKPDSNIVSGYEEYLIKTRNKRFFTGLIVEENAYEIVLMDRKKERFTIRANEIKSRIPQNISIMPSNYLELLSEQQIQDLLAYLITLKGRQSPEENVMN